MGFSSLRLVFLQACESAQSDPYQAFSGVAQRLAQKGIPAVVGMQYKILQQVANRFVSVFYESVAQKLTIDAAVQKARRTIVDESSDPAQRLAFGLPVLYLRESDSLFAPSGPANAQVTPLSGFVVCPWCSIRNPVVDKFCLDCMGSLICVCGVRVEIPRKSCGACNTLLTAGGKVANAAAANAISGVTSFGEPADSGNGGAKI